MVTLRAATTKGTVTLNPISGIQLPDTILTKRGGGGGGGDRGGEELDKTAGKNDLSRRPASKQMRCEPWGAPQQRIQRSPLSCDKRRPLTSIELTLTLPKLHLATFKLINNR